jgi:hypothetical protein
MATKQKVNIEPHPLRVLIKITQHEWSSLFSVKVRRNDGTEVDLFTDLEEQEGFERKFQQNVSVGTIVAAGTKVTGILKGDVAIIDYLVTGSDDSMVGTVNGNRLVSIIAQTTYHTESALPYVDGKKAWVEGDYDTVSPLLGVVRMGKLIARRPYVFLKYESASQIKVAESGAMYEETEPICTREVLSAHPDSGYKEGDKVVLKEANLFFRLIDGKTISVIFEEDIFCKI